jgi:hypothetical protein
MGMSFAVNALRIWCYCNRRLEKRKHKKHEMLESAVIFFANQPSLDLHTAGIIANAA